METECPGSLEHKQTKRTGTIILAKGLFWVLQGVGLFTLLLFVEGGELSKGSVDTSPAFPGSRKYGQPPEDLAYAQLPHTARRD